jgi:hypothetical protein
MDPQKWTKWLEQDQGFFLCALSCEQTCNHSLSLPRVVSQVLVSGLQSRVITTEAEALQLLFEGETNRVIGEHQLNRESSRSHSIFSLSLERKMEGEEGETVRSKVRVKPRVAASLPLNTSDAPVHG